MEAALELEKKVNQSLLDLHKVADTHGDFQVNNLENFSRCVLFDDCLCCVYCHLVGEY